MRLLRFFIHVPIRVPTALAEAQKTIRWRHITSVSPCSKLLPALANLFTEPAYNEARTSPYKLFCALSAPSAARW
jgi:hypothetical protein